MIHMQFLAQYCIAFICDRLLLGDVNLVNMLIPLTTIIRPSSAEQTGQVYYLIKASMIKIGLFLKKKKMKYS